VTAFIIGNGLSRKGIDLKLLKGTTYGCNWLYTEFKPDVLVATDNPISTHIQSSGYSKQHKFYTRKVYAGSGALKLRPQFKNWASGPNAVQLGVSDKHRTIVLLGFDFGSTGATFNNMFAGTQFYKQSNSTSTYSGNWKTQIEAIININKNIEFTIVQGTETSAIINEFNKLSNVKIISTTKFIDEYVSN